MKVKASAEEIQAAKTPAGGWTKKTLAGWGVSWPPPKGWKQALEKLSEVSSLWDYDATVRLANGSLPPEYPARCCGVTIPRGTGYWCDIHQCQAFTSNGGPRCSRRAHYVGLCPQHFNMGAKQKEKERERKKIIAGYAKEHRKNPTVAELKFRKDLQRMGIKFRSQRLIGMYIVDFILLDRDVVVEVDGNYHLTPDQQRKDKIRQGYIEKRGFKVFRLTNDQVFKDDYREFIDFTSP